MQSCFALSSLLLRRQLSFTSCGVFAPQSPNATALLCMIPGVKHRFSIVVEALKIKRTERPLRNVMHYDESCMISLASYQCQVLVKQQVETWMSI